MFGASGQWDETDLQLWEPVEVGAQDMVKEAVDQWIVESVQDLDTVDELKEEILEHQDFFAERKDMIHEILPELDDVMVDDCRDEVKKLRMTYGFTRDVVKIKRLLKKTSREAESHENEKSFVEIFRDVILAEVLGQLPSKKEDMDLTSEEDFSVLAYVAEHFEEMSDEEKKKFMQWFAELIAYYRESKLLEVYEVTVGEDGTVTIKGKLGTQHVTIKFDPVAKNFSVLSGDVAPEVLSNIAEDLQKLKQEHEKT